jgi:hypothetical protein
VTEFIPKSQAVKTELSLSERKLCRSLALPRSTYRRWHGRSCQGQQIIALPGPKKLQPLPLEELKSQIDALEHGAKRTSGSSALYAQYSEAISRREFNTLIEQSRQEHCQAQRQKLQHLQWHSPNVAWAIDGAEYTADGQGQLLLFIAVQDLASSHRFAPLPAFKLTGEQVAQYLDGLFKEHGPPLILKRDNGSIFNNEAVDAVLARWHVLPLNSPAYYPRYNGAIEKAISEIKTDLPAVLTPPVAWQIHQVKSIFAALCLQQNTQPRRRLHGRSACQAYYHDKSSRYPKRQRIAIFQSILSATAAIIKQMEEPDRLDFHAAWRAATVRWLVGQNLLSLSLKPKPKCVTPFFKNVDS